MNGDVPPTGPQNSNIPKQREGFQELLCICLQCQWTANIPTRSGIYFSSPIGPKHIWLVKLIRPFLKCEGQKNFSQVSKCKARKRKWVLWICLFPLEHKAARQGVDICQTRWQSILETRLLQHFESSSGEIGHTQ